MPGMIRTHTHTHTHTHTDTCAHVATHTQAVRAPYAGKFPARGVQNEWFPK